MFELLQEWAKFLTEGGFMMLPLLANAALLWYGLGLRLITLRRGAQGALENLLAQGPGLVLPARPKDPGFITRALALAWDLKAQDRPLRRQQLADRFFPLNEGLREGRILVRTLTAIAPLAGLLGTVTGMIEMFDSLGSQTFYSQTGGIANGISQALFTTELGLIIAVPGLIIGRLLDRREDRFHEELAQIQDHFCAKESQP